LSSYKSPGRKPLWARYWARCGL